jgi:hypothetical protein
MGNATEQDLCSQLSFCGQYNTAGPENISRAERRPVWSFGSDVQPWDMQVPCTESGCSAQGGVLFSLYIATALQRAQRTERPAAGNGTFTDYSPVSLKKYM